MTTPGTRAANGPKPQCRAPLEGKAPCRPFLSKRGVAREITGNAPASNQMGAEVASRPPLLVAPILGRLVCKGPNPMRSRPIGFACSLLGAALTNMALCPQIQTTDPTHRRRQQVHREPRPMGRKHRRCPAPDALAPRPKPNAPWLQAARSTCMAPNTRLTLQRVLATPATRPRRACR